MSEATVNLQFSLNSDNFRLLENDGYCSIAEIDFLHVGLNRNKCDISKECVEKSLQSFYNKPLLCILDNSIIPSLSSDFKEHAYSDEERKKFIAFGTIPESSTFRFVERDNGKTYLTAKVVIWKNYFPVIMNILKRRDGNVKVSIELAVIDGDQDDITGVLKINEFRLLSCVLLGEGIMEGIEGSHLEVLRFSLAEDDFKQANEYYLNFSQKNAEYELPEEVKNAIQEGLNSYKSIGKGCTTQVVTMAKNLANGTYIDRIQINKIDQSLSNSKNKEKSLTFDVLGGEVMENWINDIKEERVGDRRLKGLSNQELQEQLWHDLDKYKYHDGEWEGRKYYVEEIYSDEKIAIIRDNETAEYFKVPYEIKDGKANINMENKKPVHKTYEETTETFSAKEFSAKDITVFAKKDYGTGETITVDKSKEAMSETNWGLVNKTELRKKVLEAKNYKSLVKDVYADVQEGWEDAPSSKLKYPIMEIKDGKAVYNRYGLASALAYAQKNNETAVINKVKSLYKKLDIDNEDEGGEKEMAKELDKDKEVVENKLDKDNKDIEKVRDDADAQEDDVKEKEKKEVKNSDTCDDIGFAKEEKANKIEKDDEGEEDLEDDVDSDKDYWKKKANALEIKNAEIENELKKYKRAEEEREMAAEVDKFAHCMSEDEATELKNSIEKMSMDEMKEKINAKVAEFALKIKNKEKEEKEMKYSINPLFELNTMKFSEAEVSSLDDIISNSHAKIAGK